MIAVSDNITVAAIGSERVDVSIGGVSRSYTLRELRAEHLTSDETEVVETWRLIREAAARELDAWNRRRDRDREERHRQARAREAGISLDEARKLRRSYCHTRAHGPRRWSYVLACASTPVGGWPETEQAFREVPDSIDLDRALRALYVLEPSRIRADRRADLQASWRANR